MKGRVIVLKPTKKRPEQRPLRPKPEAERPKQYWGIDMTKFMINSIGRTYLVVVLDWFTKKIVGLDLSLRSSASEGKCALDMALEESRFVHE